MKNKEICGVYKITSPSGKIYIGSSANIKERWKNYYKLNCKKQVKLYNSFIKYGVNNHIFEIIEEYPMEDLFGWEYLWIEQFKTCEKSGLNCKSPKFGDIKAIISDKTRVLMSISASNRKTSKSACVKISDAMKKRYEDPKEREKTALATKIGMDKLPPRKHSQEIKDFLRGINLGRKQSKETIAKRVIYLKDRIFTDIHKKRLSECRPNSLLVINLETGIFFNQLKEAAIAHNIKPNLLYCGIKRKTKKYEKFKIC